MGFGRPSHCPNVFGCSPSLVTSRVYFVNGRASNLRELSSSFGKLFNITDPNVALVAVVSMQRSSSTSLLENVMVKGNDCAISLNEIFQNKTEQSGDAWTVDGKNMTGPVKRINPSLMSDFLMRVAKRRCIEMLRSDTRNHCQNRCVAGFKVFPEHLALQQHEAILKKTPNLIAVILERNVEARWESRYVAAATGDWDTTGSAKHKKKFQELKVPSINASTEFCNSKDWRWKQLCHFGSKHNDWYAFVRKILSPDERVEVSSDDAVLQYGNEAKRKIAAALPREFGDLIVSE